MKVEVSRTCPPTITCAHSYVTEAVGQTVMRTTKAEVEDADDVACSQSRHCDWRQQHASQVQETLTVKNVKEARTCVSRRLVQQE